MSSWSWVISFHQNLLDAVLELDAHGAVVPGAGLAAVDLGGLEDEAPPLGEGDDLLHGRRLLGRQRCFLHVATPIAERGASGELCSRELASRFAPPAGTACRRRA